ncbi:MULTISPECIES: helix-turn-helix transcriptional regulator [unclassified Paenibacillus]|uniref:helix-turn-helix transcriptional regulator n=1 Tax=unclassified Paenibacillus TaxID=185978 RepID=UPI00280CA8D2|nr:helix-turn-helix transcriptional regulator [Paenibacillus sp. LHD-38]MDQ8736959.1 helix-turn-helix transcriptional regulator [Paenibacillus sp. LHD-38]
MRIELGSCLLEQRLAECGMSKEQLAATLRIRPERIVDYIDNKRIMPLKAAIAIADTVGCNVNSLYELHAIT